MRGRIPLRPWLGGCLLASVLQSSIAAEAAGPPGIARDGVDIVVEADRLPLAEAVRALAAATGSVVRGADRLAQAPQRLVSHWRGRDAAEAWRRVLERDVSYVSRCGAAGCEVFIVGLIGAPAQAAAKGDAATASSTALDVLSAEATLQQLRAQSR